MWRRVLRLARAPRRLVRTVCSRAISRRPVRVVRAPRDLLAWSSRFRELAALSWTTRYWHSTGTPRNGTGSEFKRAAKRQKTMSEFCDLAFDVFDLDGNEEIEMVEIEKAYLNHAAGAEMVRLVEKYALGGKGVTWELLDLLDISKAVREGNVRTNSNGNVEKEAFNEWLENAMDKYEGFTDSLEGAQIEHE